MSRSHLHLKIKALTNRSTSLSLYEPSTCTKPKNCWEKGELNVTQVAFGRWALMT